MSKHTPGPWKVISEQTAREFEVFEVAQVAHLRVTPDRSGDTFAIAGDAYADAGLIAAAPDLLSVCKELAASAAYWSDYDVPVGIVARLRAAIAKAEGSA
jgi:hypothetical protein